MSINYPADNMPLVCAESSVAETEITSALIELAGYYGLERYIQRVIYGCYKKEKPKSL